MQKTSPNESVNNYISEAPDAATKRADVISREAILSFMKEIADRTAHTGSGKAIVLPEVVVLPVVDSTNDYAMGLCSEEGMPSGKPVLVIADEQTGGKGRYGRSFHSPKGAGIYMSFVFSPKFPVSDMIKATGVAASIVAMAIEKVCGLEPAIKWVNDIYLDCGTSGPKKVVGILAEGAGMSGIDSMVIGIGINCYKTSVPEDLEDIIGCVEAAAPSGSGMAGSGRNELIAEVCAGLTEAFHDRTALDTKPYLEYYRERCFITGRKVLVRRRGGEEFPAIAKAIGDDFSLVVSPLDGGEDVILTGGEVSLKL